MSKACRGFPNLAVNSMIEAPVTIDSRLLTVVGDNLATVILDTISKGHDLKGLSDMCLAVSGHM